MRERAALVDGTLEARAEGQSFRVTARLPYREAT
jgi:signal transduction histidine kinase